MNKTIYPKYRFFDYRIGIYSDGDISLEKLSGYFIRYDELKNDNCKKTIIKKTEEGYSEVFIPDYISVGTFNSDKALQIYPISVKLFLRFIPKNYIEEIVLKDMINFVKVFYKEEKNKVVFEEEVYKKIVQYNEKFNMLKNEVNKYFKDDFFKEIIKTIFEEFYKYDLKKLKKEGMCDIYQSNQAAYVLACNKEIII